MHAVTPSGQQIPPTQQQGGAAAGQLPGSGSQPPSSAPKARSIKTKEQKDALEACYAGELYHSTYRPA